MTPNEYQKLSQVTRCPQDSALDRMDSYTFGNHLISQTIGPSRDRITYDSGAKLLHAHLGISGETGELAGAIEKYMYYGQDFNRRNVIEELGDLLWYIAEACDAIGVDMETVMRLNIVKLQDKFKGRYKEAGFDPEAAKEENRDRKAEADLLTEGKTTDDPEPINTEAINDRPE